MSGDTWRRKAGRAGQPSHTGRELCVGLKEGVGGNWESGGRCVLRDF